MMLNSVNLGAKLKKYSKITIAAVLMASFVTIPMAKPAHAVNGYPLTPFYQVVGKYVLSTDGLGTTSPSGTIQVEKPSATAVVKKAFLMSSAKSGGTASPTAPGIAGTTVTYAKEVSGQTLADVTSIVAPTIDNAAAGITSLTITNANSAEGHALAVVFYDPSLTYSASVVLSFGRADTVGSTTNFDFSNVLSKQNYMDVTMSLGLSFSYQGATQSNSYSCITFTGCGQYSRISITLNNSTTPLYVSSTSGGADDAAQAPTNGNLLSVGGVADQVSKPVDSASNQTTTTPLDNELYSLIDLLPNGTTGFSLSSVNPSANDYLFFAGFYFKGIVARGTDASGNSSLPVITAVTPCFGPIGGGTSVSIDGSNLTGATSVKFGTAAATITSNSATNLVVTSPSGSAGFTDIEVTTSAGSTVEFDAFQYGNALTTCEGSVAAVVNSGSPPDTPGKPTVTSSGTSATITVTPPSSGVTPTSYTVTASPGGQTCTVTGASGSCSISGLTAGVSYTFTSTATNATGTSSASTASDSITISSSGSGSGSTTPTTSGSTGTTSNATYIKKKSTKANSSAAPTPSASASTSSEPSASASATSASNSNQNAAASSSSNSNATGVAGILAAVFGAIAAFIWFVLAKRRKADKKH